MGRMATAIIGSHEVDFRAFGYRGKFVYYHGQPVVFGKTNRNLNILLRRFSVPFLIALVIMTFSGTPASLYLTACFSR